MVFLTCAHWLVCFYPTRSLISSAGFTPLSSTFLVGAILMGFAPSLSFLMIGRIVAGIALMIGLVYVAECFLRLCLVACCCCSRRSSSPWEFFITTGRRRAGECFGDFGKLGFRSDINNFLMILKKKILLVRIHNLKKKKTIKIPEA